ncbi:response regulator [Desulfatibacillum aliphaticivorans]|uniref:Protein with response regulator receiver domain n=1 Tax=Desulfatibacillum aliphaticivorans TaxID=218208 RepID=B8FIY1_DESAL|nr:response regulator [Desulfatibacillum aliphaticivorans]ACL04372.1 Protein with response regulator receiver domain [Desulfatibacillum aliphaticivorans]
MSHGLNVIILDDDPDVCMTLKEIVESFYTWGDVFSFTDPDEATDFCRSEEAGVAIFILDVFLGDRMGFVFLDAITDKFPAAYEDTIVISGEASKEVVDVCVASEITYLLEKPVRPYALQMAVRAIVAKYIKFAKKILDDPILAAAIGKM